jgi:hypothetical protein
MSRPSLYTAELTTEICERLAEGRSLRSICADDDMPGMRTVLDWLERYPDFRAKYGRAREIQAELQVDEMVEIADDSRNDWMERNDPKNPGYVANGENIQRAKLRLEQRRWFAEKLLPKKYGNKVAIGGAEGLPPVQTMSLDEIARRAAFLFTAAADGAEKPPRVGHTEPPQQQQQH